MMSNLRIQNALHQAAIWGVVLFISISVGILVLGSGPTPMAFAQGPQMTLPATPETACQWYRLTVPEALVRNCSNTSCAVVGSVNARDALCITGVAEDNLTWNTINLETGDDAKPVSGFISANLIEPGLPGQETSLVTYCDQYRVIVPELVVRECSEIGCPALGSLSEGEIVCARDYKGSYVGWLLIQSNIGQEEWVDQSLLTIAEGDDNCDAWRAVNGGETRDCASITCDVVRSLAVGEVVCVIDEDDQDLEWISVSYEDTTGWVYANLLESLGGIEVGLINPVMVEAVPTETPTLTETATLTLPAPPSITPAVMATLPPSSPSPSAPQTCWFYRVAVDSAIVRSRPTTDSTPLTTIARDTRVCVVGVVPYLENDWFIVNLNPAGEVMSEGFMYQPLLLPILEAVPRPTASPLPAEEQTQDTASDVTITPGNSNAGALVACPTGDDRNPFDVGGSPASDNSTPYPPGYCATVTPTPLLTPPPTQVASEALLSQDIPLSILGLDNFEIASPQGSTRFRFSIPDDWNPVGSTVLYLNIEYFESINANVDEETASGLVTQLDIRLDDILISSASLTAENVGVQTLQIPLPPEVLVNPDRRSHRIDIQLSARDHCRAGMASRILSRSDMSFIHFEYNEFLPLLDLGTYPRPFYNSRPNNEIETVVVVLPAQPQQADLDASASIVAGLGLLTSNDVAIRVSEADVLTAQERQANHLILIGEIGTNELIDLLYASDELPTHLDEAGGLLFDDTILDDGDGVIQVISHPENPKRAILVVTGKSGDAVVRAAQALAGPPSIMGLGGTLGIISDTQPILHITETDSRSTRFTFSQLEADEDIVVSGVGPQLIEIDFDLPFGGQITDEAYVDILFNNSPAIESTSTVFTVIMNDTPIASALLTDHDSTKSGEGNIRRLRAAIPPSTVIPGGRNTLTLVVDIQGNWQCDPPSPTATWFSVSKDSAIYLPRTGLEGQSFNLLVAHFPVPFNLSPNLQDVLISLPADPQLWEIEQAMQLLSRLGNGTANGEGLIPKVYFGEIPDTVQLSDYQLIVFGRPSTNPLLKQINDYLPQPFVPDSDDELQQTLDDVTYRLLPGFEVGILQTLQSPWADGKGILVITGTTDNGQRNAADALTSYRFGRSEMLGNVVFVSGNSVSAVDTRYIYNALELLETVPDFVAEAILEPSPTPTVVYTVTPGPTVTLKPSDTPFVPTQRPEAIVTVVTESPTLTPVPTFEPLAVADLEPVETALPGWANMLMGFTVVMILLASLFGVYRMIQSFRSRKQI